MTLLLSREDLAGLLDLGEVIEVVAGAFAAYSGGQTVTPPRSVLEPPGTEGVVLTMPCAIAPAAGPAAAAGQRRARHRAAAAGRAAEHGSPVEAGQPADVRESGVLGTKVIAIYRGNAARGLPTVSSLYVLNDYATGRPLAVMDGAWLTAARTAAGSAVATRLLARPEARTLGVFGTGTQARVHVQAIQRVRPIERVLVAATSPEKAEDFVRWVTETTGLAAVAASHTAASAADVLAACTTSPAPVVVAEEVRPGAHVNAVGAFTPATRELPTALVARAAVYVDTREGALAEAGDLLLPAQEGAFSLDAVRGEVGELLLGRIEGRRDPEEVTLYKSVGAAFLDAATARLAYERAVARGLGQRFSFM